MIEQPVGVYQCSRCEVRSNKNGIKELLEHEAQHVLRTCLTCKVSWVGLEFFIDDEMIKHRLSNCKQSLTFFPSNG